MTYRPITNLWSRLKDGVALTVPEEDALCAFECNKARCTSEEWATCYWRLHKAAGVFMPQSARHAETRN